MDETKNSNSEKSIEDERWTRQNNNENGKNNIIFIL